MKVVKSRKFLISLLALPCISCLYGVYNTLVRVPPSTQTLSMSTFQPWEIGVTSDYIIITVATIYHDYLQYDITRIPNVNLASSSLSSLPSPRIVHHSCFGYLREWFSHSRFHQKSLLSLHASRCFFRRCR